MYTGFGLQQAYTILNNLLKININSLSQPSDPWIRPTANPTASSRQLTPIDLYFSYTGNNQQESMKFFEMHKQPTFFIRLETKNNNFFKKILYL